MFCPNCGKADQTVNSYCRQCGKFLPDFDNLKKRETSPEEHFKVNTILNIMSGVVSITLAVLLYAFFLGKQNTPPIIYITAGFLTAMFAWQVQVFIRNLKLKNQLLKKNKTVVETSEEKAFNSAEPKRLLNEPDLSEYVPASVTEYTTKNLKVKK